MKTISEYIQKNLDTIYHQSSIIRELYKKDDDYIAKYEIISYELNVDYIKLKIKNQKTHNVHYLPNQVYRIKEKFDSNESSGDSLSKIICSKEELWEYISGSFLF